MGWNEGDQLLHLGQPPILRPEVPHPENCSVPLKVGCLLPQMVAKETWRGWGVQSDPVPNSSGPCQLSDPG